MEETTKTTPSAFKGSGSRKVTGAFNKERSK